MTLSLILLKYRSILILTYTFFLEEMGIKF